MTGTVFVAEPVPPTFEEPPIFDPALIEEDPVLLRIVEVLGVPTPFPTAALALA